VVASLVRVRSCERGGLRPKIDGRWSDSPSERRIRGYCCERGIPRSVFLGRVVGPGEPEWLAEDTEAALEWIDYVASLCKGCGEPLAECLDPENDGAYEAIPVQCHACAARDAENRDAAKARTSDRYGEGSFDGLFVGVRKINRAKEGGVSG